MANVLSCVTGITCGCFLNLDFLPAISHIPSHILSRFNVMYLKLDTLPPRGFLTHPRGLIISCSIFYVPIESKLTFKNSKTDFNRFTAMNTGYCKHLLLKIISYFLCLSDIGCIHD